MKKMTLMQHFSELRRRILFVVVGFLAAFAIGWYVSDWLLEFIVAPLINVWTDGVLMYSGLTDGLMLRLSLAALFGLLVIIPLGLWNLWAFVAPGLKKQERKLIWPVLFLSPVLFLLGAAFAFYLLFPIVFNFFVQLNQVVDMPVIMLPDARSYVAFAIGMLKVFGVVFQLPLILVLMNRIGVLPRSRVVAMRRYAIVLIVVVAAVLTPPDVVSQLMLAIPMWILFEISILFMRNK